MILHDPRFTKPIRFNYEPFYDAYNGLLDTGRVDVVWSKWDNAHAFIRNYGKVHVDFNYHHLPKILTKLNMDGELDGFLDPLNSKRKDYDASYLFQIDDVQEMSFIKNLIWWSGIPDQGNGKIQRLMIHYVIGK